MDSIKSLLLEYQKNIYLIPTMQFINLVRPKELAVQEDSLTALFQDETVFLKHSLDQSHYCAILHQTDRQKLVVPLSKAPKPINITAQNLSWHVQEKKMVIISHPDYPDTIAEIL
tara:strand:- start:3227 stop:3571 length:345 start_codon:yes stop_codon:yes gene_type:complete